MPLSHYAIWKINLTYCLAALVGEDHPVPILTRHLNCHQCGSHQDGKNCHHQSRLLLPLQPAIRHCPQLIFYRRLPPEAAGPSSGCQASREFGTCRCKHRDWAHRRCSKENLNSFLQPICNLGFWESKPHETSDGFPNSGIVERVPIEVHIDYQPEMVNSNAWSINLRFSRNQL